MTLVRRFTMFLLGTLLLALPALGAPLGLPPLPLDPVLSQVAPEESLAYAAFSGSGEADPTSANHTEQLFAEEEVQALAQAIENSLRETLKKQTKPEDLAKFEAVWKLVRTATTRPAAAFISKIIASQDVPPDIEAGLVVNTGEETAAVRQAIELLLSMAGPQAQSGRAISVDGVELKPLPVPPGGPPVYWGIEGSYFLVAVSQPAAEQIVAGIKGQRSQPAWLARIRQALPVERVATLGYLNVQGIHQLAAPFAPREATRVLGGLGISSIKSLSLVSGLEGEGLLSRGWVEIDGEPKGLLGLAAGEPLQAADLAAIPADATLAAAARFDLAAALQETNPIWNELNPGVRQVLQLQIKNEALGFSIERLAKSLGSVWTLHSSPSEGGLLITGLTIVVPVKERVGVQQTLDALVGLFRGQFPAEEPQPGQPRKPRLDELEFRGQRLYVLGLGDPVPVAPTICLTDKELIIAAYPQSVKSYLARTADFRSLAEVPQVQEALRSGGGPLALAYQDTGAIVRTLYPLAQASAPSLTAELRKNGVQLSAGLLPSLAAIERHLRPGVAVVSRTSEGFMFRSTQTAPLSGLVGAAPLAAGFLLPAVQSTREAAVRAQASNNLKQIGLAMHNYHAVNNSFPASATYTDDDKPLLSWRVHILPFIEQNDLYKEFHLDEPWDSEHNKKLIPRMPAAYKTPNRTDIGEGKTVYLALRGDKTIFEGYEGARIQDISDGTSNTILAVEASPDRAVTWTAPDDLAYDPEKPLDGLGGIHANGFLVLFADGSVRFLAQTIDPGMLKAMFTMSGGEVIGQ